MAGGKLIQHVTGHNNTTDSIYYQGKVLNIPSDHHQMMYPFNMEDSKYQIVGHSKYHLSDKYLNDYDENIELPSNFVEPEIIYYPETKSLCIQGHPEMTNCPENTQHMIFNLINYYLKL